MDRSRDAGDLLTEVRIAHNLTSTLYYAGRLDEAAVVCRDGIDRARATGVLWMGYGVSLLVFAELIRYVDRRSHAGAAVARLGAGLRGRDAVGRRPVRGRRARRRRTPIERGQAVKADWHSDPMMAMLSGGCTIDALTWAGRSAGGPGPDAVGLIDFMDRSWNDYFLGGIWLSALGLAALADRAEQTRLAGGDPAADVEIGDTP